MDATIARRPRIGPDPAAWIASPASGELYGQRVAVKSITP
jgi:hypothetical protein